ncbi:11482_t:CDS:1 [Diversispora eburnea]|uniref:11482_t:CDS:1 n=1 Tax=Diversispora eburnea TaxID=1213867 RepID=A0A9N8UUY2_9GLOM|nr:11482_t:CDS:1 [Diversispora eburnea]
MVKVTKALKPSLDFRRSVTKDKISTPIAIPDKPPPSILPPKKVIKALYDYEANAPNELSFSKGDFYHVVGNENDPNWYEACNPATNVKGLVPISYFQVLEKSGRLSGDEKAESGIFSEINNSGNKPQPLYGIVLYDFSAERPDELDAKAGEPIIVIAQSNHEWFVAKPIGRLGGPGLIPVSFIEIRDHATGKAIENVKELMDKSVVPKVEEWKKMTQDYQENSISLGRLDFSADSKLAPVGMESKSLDPKLAPVSFDLDKKLAPMSFDIEPINLQDSNASGKFAFTKRNSDASNTLPTSPTDLEESDLSSQDNEIIAASVDSFHFEEERYWFLIRAELASGCFRLLYRLYEDFYEFQIALLNKFPEEAGRTGKQRILPFMPGPLSYVNDMITAQRRADLDIYVKELLSLPPYILQDSILQQLFALRDGDVETPTDPRQPIGANGKSSLDSSPIDPLPPTKSYQTMQSSVINSSLNGGGYKHSNNSVSGQSFIKSSRVHDESINFSTTNIPNTKSTITNKQSFIKIKVLYREDLIAIRVSASVTYAKLREKLNERLGGHVTNLKYKDDNTNEILSLDDDDHLRHAIANCPKLLIYVE